GKCSLHRSGPSLRVLSRIDCLFGQLESEQGLPGYFPRKFESEAVEFVAVDDMVDHAEPMGVPGAHELRSEEHFFRPAYAQFPWVLEKLRAAHAHRHGVVCKKRVIGRDDDVARPYQHEAGCDHASLDLCDHWLGNVAPPLRQALVDFL